MQLLEYDILYLQNVAIVIFFHPLFHPLGPGDITKYIWFIIGTGFGLLQNQTLT